MRFLLALLAIAAVLGCDQRVPAPKPPRPPDTPSSLVVVPSNRSGPDTLFDLPTDKLYIINGGWKNRADGKKGEYERPGEFTIEKADEKEIDPKDIVPYIDRWIEGSKVRVINQRDAPASAERIRRTIDYRTERTDGVLTYTVAPGAPAKKLTITVDVRERRR